MHFARYFMHFAHAFCPILARYFMHFAHAFCPILHAFCPTSCILPASNTPITRKVRSNTVRELTMEIDIPAHPHTACVHPTKLVTGSFHTITCSCSIHIGQMATTPSPQPINTHHTYLLRNHHQSTLYSILQQVPRRGSFLPPP